jgi:DNA-directed RNA polymerase subunit omega
MIDPPIEELLSKVDSKFTLVTLSSTRARQINSYFNQLGEGLGAIVPPQVTSLARKPLSIALEEIAEGKVRAGELPVEGAEDGDGENAEGPSEVIGDDVPPLEVLADIGDLDEATEEPSE